MEPKSEIPGFQKFPEDDLPTQIAMVSEKPVGVKKSKSLGDFMPEMVKKAPADNKKVNI